MTILFTACPNSAGVKPADGADTGTGGGTGGGTVPPTPGTYVKVPYDTLEDYLANTASSEAVNYIEVTGNIPEEHFCANVFEPSTLSKKLKAHPDKKVALKIETYPTGLTDMTACFEACTSLTTAPDIPKGVTDIRWCFTGCTSLRTALAIPEGVTNMANCFDGCTSLTTVPAIPKGVTDMTNCFAYCTSLTTVPDILEGVTDIPYCFYGCTGLTTAPAIPVGVTDMGSCFANCTSLTTAPAIPASVTVMGNCFYACTKLTGVTLNCNYNAGNFNYSFQGCTALQNGSIKVPAEQLTIYKANADAMGTAADKFAAIAP
ncbi:hypothetical protein TPE_2408 [Treponema pedis str. T A4]|uniref:Uncharacterized protein n=3 Tax=Treponema pedis TaxID=409322 RepID=S5ZQE6_9SPIR|nr:hypothetical protein TPE_2408 [Treponema pedis str. T A4]